MMKKGMKMMKRFEDKKCNTVSDVIGMMKGAIAGCMLISLINKDETDYERLLHILVDCFTHGVNELERITGVTVKDGE